MNSNDRTEIQILTPDQYRLLDAVPEPDRVLLSPTNTWVAGAINDGRLVGRLVAVSLPHIECAWIDPAHRNGRLLHGMESALTGKLKALGAGIAIAFAVDQKMETYCRRLGYSQFATAWRKDL